ncbi:hypothetical protein P872_09225 [Rhodonellum psychrophilum GCM71 = DSM 17998]|uniref:UDP-N-acetylglucosamine 2-epimerase domain-containing protein n=2 Tax=Rhodonellum TaxID=336827 RepID=U5BY15_9BACT|nr:MULTISPECIES: UDP-N-acetylglucosamine 2-epimerase [Rhodonellum]ERM81526.1 hypothetical protein P872_09225 [Rhodonellum psychrophilum GCM71 = DSM 17998]SDZ40676.1 GDP/UDP-N,N'-diacetylbacillosamine 2-epimerase (hydrolysing) [Rhodonellum ikkaensis]
MIKVGILTSSRADYGIYLPLLKALQADEYFELKIIVFGTHLSRFHGYTVNQIEEDGFVPFAKIESILVGDTSNAISSTYALTALKFADFWGNYHFDFDVVFALGDRFEMAAAVAASIPFQVKLAHLYGGETTLGAIDNIYRHFISLSSTYHFVATESFAKRVYALLGEETSLVYNVGSLSLENLLTLPLLSIDEFNDKWGIDLEHPTILVTVHPETVAFQKNQNFCTEIAEALLKLSKKFQVVITMPNADTSGMLYRRRFEHLSKLSESIKIIENFGTQSYFTCMKYSKILVGNTSSGIVESASFNKYVLNLGDRQKGRLSNDNVVHLPFDSDIIYRKVFEFIDLEYNGNNIFYHSKPSQTIIKILKDNQ